jgi:methylmalonyl-CoA/ethylmalonyl-CoA epimerase
MHHLCYRVDDLLAALADFQRQGYQLIDAEPRPGASGHQVAFLHPRSSTGVLLELLERRP